MLALMREKPARFLALAARVARWYAHRATSNVPRPLSCGMYLTNRCNLTCEMCNIFRHPDQGFLDMGVYERIVSGLSRLGCFYLSFAGGEPFLDPNLGQRIRFAKVGIPYVHVVTNGLSLTERRIQEVVEAGLDEISVSVDGMQEDHDRIRGVAGSFQKTMAGIDTWRRVAPKVPLVVNSIISPSNLSSLMELAEVIRSRGLMHKFQPVNLHPEFPGMESAAVRHSWDAQNVERVREFLRAVRPFPNVVNSPYFLSQIPAYLAGKVDRGLFVAPCRYGTHHMEVTSDGKIFPCLTGMNWTKGFTLEGTLEELLASQAYREVVTRLEHCTGCRDNMYICNFEPRIAFPVENFLAYRLRSVLEPLT
jgi:MoaA/NifB/PqqE/SkfB family radical SAM enzyme